MLAARIKKTHHKPHFTILCLGESPGDVMKTVHPQVCMYKYARVRAVVCACPGTTRAVADFRGWVVVPQTSRHRSTKTRVRGGFWGRLQWDMDDGEAGAEAEAAGRGAAIIIIPNLVRILVTNKLLHVQALTGALPLPCPPVDCLASKFTSPLGEYLGGVLVAVVILLQVMSWPMVGWEISPSNVPVNIGLGNCWETAFGFAWVQVSRCPGKSMRGEVEVPAEHRADGNLVFRQGRRCGRSDPGLLGSRVWAGDFRGVVEGEGGGARVRSGRAVSLMDV